MFLLIREKNSWKHQDYFYLIDLNKQTGKALDMLFEFFRISNNYYQRCCKEVPIVYSVLGGAQYFAESIYFYYFIDAYETIDNKLCTKTQKFTDVKLCLNQKISIGKMRSALIAMRKGENKFYRNFESAFLK
jgi:hypothetical protein